MEKERTGPFWAGGLRVWDPGILAPSFLVPFGLILAFDFLSKGAVWSYVQEHAPGGFSYLRVPVREPWLYLARVENRGMLGGWAGSHTWLLALVRSLIALGLFLLAWRTSAWRSRRLAGHGLVAGGVSGNLCDNLFREGGGVRDIFDVYLPLPGGTLDLPIFNLADLGVVLGVLLLLFALRGEEREKARRAAEFRGKAG